MTYGTFHKFTPDRSKSESNTNIKLKKKHQYFSNFHLFSVNIRPDNIIISITLCNFYIHTKYNVLKYWIGEKKISETRKKSVWIEKPKRVELGRELYCAEWVRQPRVVVNFGDLCWPRRSIRGTYTPYTPYAGVAGSTLTHSPGKLVVEMCQVRSTKLDEN